MRDHINDAAHGSLATTFVIATMNGWSIQEWAACAALTYTVILIIDKLFPGFIGVIRRAIGKLIIWAWTWFRALFARVQ